LKACSNTLFKKEVFLSIGCEFLSIVGLVVLQFMFDALESSFIKIIDKKPANIDINTDAITLYIVKNQPNAPKVAMIESTPVIGVEIKNVCNALLLAPLFFKDEAKGITLHEQSGRGIPIRADLKMELEEFLPICFCIKPSGIICFKTPATISPKIIKNDISVEKCQKFSKNL
jgi:hypothetical protein